METKNLSKSEAEMVDVMDTLQHVISIIEKEMAKNVTFLQKGIDTRNTNNATLALNSLHQTVSMMKSTTEQIIDQFLFKLGTLTTVEDAHNNAHDGRHVVAKITVMSKDRRDSTRN